MLTPWAGNFSIKLIIGHIKISARKRAFCTRFTCAAGETSATQCSGRQASTSMLDVMASVQKCMCVCCIVHIMYGMCMCVDLLASVYVNYAVYLTRN